MRKSLNVIKIIASIVICLFVVLPGNQSMRVDAATNSRSGILPTKEWKINFSKNVNSDYVNSKYIYAADDYGNPVDITLSVNPSNPKQVSVKPKLGQYVLGKTYILTISKDFCDENGNKIGQDYTMQFSIKKQLIDTADFKVQVNQKLGIALVTLNSISSPDVKAYRVEGQDEKDGNVSLDGEAVIFGSLQTVTVHFYDASGNEIGNCLINVQKASDSQVVQIINE